jgi:hypothetical protein
MMFEKIASFFHPIRRAQGKSIKSRVHVKFVGEVDTIVLPIISMDNDWSPFVTSTEAVWPSGEVCLQRNVFVSEMLKKV